MKKIILLIGIVTVIIAGGYYVMKPKPELTFFKEHEELAKLEEIEGKNTQKLVEEAKKENQLYQTITQEGAEDSTIVLPKIKEALAVVKSSKVLNEENSKSLKELTKLAKDSNKYINQIRDDKAKSNATKMGDLYEKRLKTFEEIRLEYDKALAMEQTLYKMLGNSETSLKDIDEIVMKLRAHYDIILKLNSTFNEITKMYNENKQALYMNIKNEK